MKHIESEKLKDAIEIMGLQRKINDLCALRDKLKSQLDWPEINLDVLRSMSAEGMAEFLDKNRKQAYDDIRATGETCYESHKEGWLLWLKENVANEGNNGNGGVQLHS